MSLKLALVLSCTGLVIGAATVAAQDAPKETAPASTDADETEVELPPIYTTPVLRRPPPLAPAPPAPPATRPPSLAPPSLARGASPRNVARWASRFDYPSGADILGEEGTTGIMVTVLPNGRSSDCVISQTSGFDRLDSRACQAMLRYSRFYPALDGKGDPTLGSYATRVTWRVSSTSFDVSSLDWVYPKEAREQRLEGKVGIAFEVDPEGKVSNCLITRSSGSSILDLATCQNVERHKGSEAVQAEGASASTRTVRRTFDWELPTDEK